MKNRVTEVLRKEIGAESLTIHNLETLSEQEESNGEIIHYAKRLRGIEAGTSIRVLFLK